MAESLPVHLKIKPLSLKETLQGERQQLGRNKAKEALRHTDNERNRDKSIKQMQVLYFLYKCHIILREIR